MSRNFKLPDAVISLIEDKLSLKLRYPSDCRVLQQSVFETTKEHIGLTTLKRMLGFIDYPNSPRSSTLDVIARYIGYPAYDLLLQDIGDSTNISAFADVESVDVCRLSPGDILVVSYIPHRRLELEYLGESVFNVLQSSGSKLHQGDRIIVSQFAKGFEFIASDVVRNGLSLGGYVGAKQGGLTEIIIKSRL